MSHYFVAKNITQKIDKTTILNNISFVANKGEFVTLLGPSGCGKSSLLRAISGLAQINSGAIYLDEQNITNSPPQKRQISMVFQNYALFPNMNVFKNIEFGLKVQKQKSTKKEREDLVHKMAELVDLKKHLHKYPDQLSGGQCQYNKKPNQLSGGQCQRVALARSLIINPKLLLLDEPLSALDAKIRKHLRQQIKMIQKELDLTVLFVTHDQEEALELSDKIIILNQGSIEQEGDSKAIYLTPKSHFVASFIGNYNLLTPSQFKQLTNESVHTTVAIRPETIIPSNQGITAKVIDFSLLGNVIRFKLESQGVVLYMDRFYRTQKDIVPINELITITMTEKTLINNI